MTNSIKFNANGPMIAKGDIDVSFGDTSEEKSSAYLCRCGASANKPYCDGAHKTSGYEDSGTLGDHKFDEGETSDSGKLTVAAKTNGPLIVSGPVTLSGGESRCHTDRVFICRCGQSKNRPYCDGSHKADGFQAD